MTAEIEGARVESYSGYKADEAPRALIIDGVRLEIVEVLLRKRVITPPGGGTVDTWRCRLEDGRTVTVELLGNGTWRVSARPDLPRDRPGGEPIGRGLRHSA